MASLALVITACSSSNTTKHTIETKKYPFYINTSQIIGADVELQFLDGVDDLPYIESQEWYGMMNSFYASGNIPLLRFNIR